MMTKGSLLLQKVRHYFKKCQNVVITSTSLTWCQKHVMKTKGSLLLKKVRHKIKNTSWRKNVKNLSWSKKYVMMWKSLSWSQKYFMTTKSSSWRKKHTWRQKVGHDIKKCVLSSKIPCSILMGWTLPTTGMWRGEVFAITDCLVVIAGILKYMI